jgi:stage II sporulation protein D
VARRVGGAPIRVSLASVGTRLSVTATGPWRIITADGRELNAGAEVPVSVERDGDRIRAASTTGGSTGWHSAPITIRATSPDATLRYGSRRYRGDLVLHPTDTGIAVVNVLSMDDYLRGVVPLEIGRGRTEAELAAVEAQAIVARSFALAKLGGSSATHDIRASTLDQVYGGVEAETALADRAIARTAGLVLRFGGRVVSAPYHSTCGGRTAAAREVWRSAGEPYLLSVDDAVPGTNRHWCDISPRFRYSRSWTGSELQRTVDANLRRYAAVPPGGPGKISGVAVLSRTESGRVAELELTTISGSRYRLRGNDIRFVLRAPDNELLESTNFNVAVARDADGSVGRLSISGSGYGHGVGMCQWGAIARARAGSDFRAILAAYYPGTDVGPPGGG